MGTAALVAIIFMLRDEEMKKHAGIETKSEPTKSTEQLKAERQSDATDDEVLKEERVG